MSRRRTRPYDSRRQVIVPLPPCTGAWCTPRNGCAAYHAPFRGTPRDENGLPIDLRVCPAGQDMPFPPGTTHVAIYWTHRVPVAFQGFAGKVSGQGSGQQRGVA